MGEVITVKHKATVEKILNILKENAPKKSPILLSQLLAPLFFSKLK